MIFKTFNSDIEDLSNEALSDKIEKYQEWYNKAQDVLDTINDLYDQQRDLIRQKLDNVLNYYSDLDSYLSSVTSKFESLISLNDEMGKRSSLTDLIEQFASLSERLDSVTNSSANNITSVTKSEGSLGSSRKVAEAREHNKQHDLIHIKNRPVYDIYIKLHRTLFCMYKTYSIINSSKTSKSKIQPSSVILKNPSYMD